MNHIQITEGGECWFGLLHLTRKTILCHVAIFVNDAACFNYSRSASLAGTRNTVRFSTLSRNTAGRMDPEVRGALLARSAVIPGVVTRH